MDDDLRVRAFKERIGFEKSVGAKKDGRGVVASWPDCLDLLGLKAQGWTCIGDNISPHVGFPFKLGMAQRRCRLTKSEKGIRFEIYVSSTGPDVAAACLVEIAANTMTGDIPYERAPQPLGDLAVKIASQSPEIQDFIWLFHNLCLRLVRRGPEPDVFPIAQAIQKFAEQHVVDRVAEFAPKIRKITTSSTRIRPGESVRVAVELEGAMNSKDLLIDFWEEGDHLSLEDSGPTWSNFRGEAPGITEIQVRVVNKKTLLSSFAVVKLEVAASEGSGT